MLFIDLLIGVTGFFRDQDTFEALRTEIVPRLFDRKEEGSVIRVWVPGCATGEEAYSPAILLREHADRVARPGPTLQVFATDIDEPAIATARRPIPLYFAARHPGGAAAAAFRARRGRQLHSGETTGLETGYGGVGPNRISNGGCACRAASTAQHRRAGTGFAM